MTGGNTPADLADLMRKLESDLHLDISAADWAMRKPAEFKTVPKFAPTKGMREAPVHAMKNVASVEL